MARILVIEDSPSLCRLYELAFEQDGYDVVIAQDMTQSLRAFETVPPDLVVLGIRLRTMDGLEAVRRILGHHRNVRLVINSGSASYSNNFLNWAADAYLLKSSDTSELRSTIRSLLRDRLEQAGRLIEAQHGVPGQAVRVTRSLGDHRSEDRACPCPKREEERGAACP